MDLYEVTRAGTVNGEASIFLDYVVASSLTNAASIHQQVAPEGLVLSIRGLGSVLAVEADSEEVDTDAVSTMGFRVQEDDDDEAEEESSRIRCRQGEVRGPVRTMPKRQGHGLPS